MATVQRRSSDASGLSWEDSNIRIAFYNGNALPYTYTDPITGVRTTIDMGPVERAESSDPYFDIAIDVSKYRMAALLQGHKLLDLIMKMMPSLPGNTLTQDSGPKLYKREDVHIEGVWFMDHGNLYDGDNMNPMDPGFDNFTAFFQQLGNCLNNNNGGEATINLRGCMSAVSMGKRRSPAAEAAVQSGHTVTGALGMVWDAGQSPWGQDKGPMYYCKEGYMAFTPEFKSDGSPKDPWPHPCDDYHTSSTWIYDRGCNPSNSSGGYGGPWHYAYQNDVWMY